MTTAASMKRHCFVSSGLLLLVVLLLSTQISVVHCRALRSPTSGSTQQREVVAHKSAGGAASLPVSSNNSSGGDTGTSVRSLVFTLASGPSKKGPGH